MDALQAIMGRRSIRRYEDRPVEDDKVDALIRAAMAAPSAGNEQSWRFIVVTDRDRLDKLADASPFAGLLERAPLAIVVCGDTTAEKHHGFWLQDCAAATENILLAAHALGLGAVWLGFYPIEERVEGVRQICKLPDALVPFSIVALGHPTEEKPPADRYNDEYVKRETWL